MIVMRPVETADVDALFELSNRTGGGLTTLPPDRDVLEKRIAWSVDSFTRTVKTAGNEYYLFVAADAESGKVVGTSGIFATVGLVQPFYSYRILKLTQVSREPDMKVDTQLLQLVNDYAGVTEIGTLFLEPNARKPGNGGMLSRGRYLMMAALRDRFADKIMAEIRGWVGADGRSPFWEAIARHFFQMEYREADRISGMGNSQFIADLMPKFPIYTNLLPESAQAVIGRPHEGARGAVRLLEAEGFRFGGAVDIFDAGPCYEVPRERIRTIQASQSGPYAGEERECDGEEMIIAKATMPDFRVTRGWARRRGMGVVVDARSARLLSLEAGQTVVFAPLSNSKGIKP